MLNPTVLQSQSQLRLHIQYNIRNSGTTDFVPPAGFNSVAECDTKPAILGFLDLQGFPGTSDPLSGNMKYAPCVVDDVISPGAILDCAYAGTGGMKITANANYGISKSIVAKYSLDAAAIDSFLFSHGTDPTAAVMLRVNPYLSDGTGTTNTFDLGALSSIITNPNAAPVTLNPLI